MTLGWSRQREDSKLSAWAKSQDLAIVERELERAQKDFRRAGSVSLKPEYILKRQQERARAKDATNRLSSIGLSFDLGPFLFDHPIQPSDSSSKPTIKRASSEQLKILDLKNELARLKERESDLESALAISERKRDEERKLFQRDRKLMMFAIAKLKAELTYSWNRIIKLKQKYEGANFGIESGRTSSNNIYQTDECFERIFRPSSARATSEKADRTPFNRSMRPATLATSTYPDNRTNRSQPTRKSSMQNSKPNTTSSLKNTPERSRSCRTSLS